MKFGIVFYLRKLLLSERLSKRLFSLWVVGIGLNMAAWTVGFYLLPEGALQGIFPGGELISSDGDLGQTILTILLYNVLIAGGLVLTANLFRVGWLPLGYVPALAHWMLFGLFLGTNSFDMAKEATLVPSLTHLVGRIGFVEISAYTFIAAASINLFLYRQRSWLDTTTEKVRAWHQLRLSRCEMIAIGVGVILIVLGAYRESLSILLQ